MLCPAALLAGGHSYPAQPCSPRLFCSPRSLCLLLPQRNEEAAKEGRPLELFWRRQYVPQEGMFRDPPADLQLGTRLPEVGLCGRRLSLGPPEAFMLCCARGPLPKLAALL